MSDKDTSKYISLILRHKPEVIGITLDEHGWADVEALIEGRTRGIPFYLSVNGVWLTKAVETKYLEKME